MKNKTLLLFLLIVLLFGVVGMSIAGADSLPGEMVMAGTWHGDEVVAKNGERWLALVKTSTGYLLQEVAINVEMTEDEVLDVPPAKTGKRIIVPGDLKVVMLVRGLPQLQAGLVAAADLAEVDLRTDRPGGIYYNGMMHELEFVCAAKDRARDQADCPLQLSVAGKKQALQNYPIYRPGTPEQSIASEGFPQILWAGDLDRDGHLDLLLDLTNHYNVSAPTLLLSSLAKKGELVRAVAMFRTTGC
jgi:hypothetical protein